MRNDQSGNALIIPRPFDLSEISEATVATAITGTASGTINVGTIPAGGCQVLMTNAGTQTVFFRTDGTVPTASNGIPILANTQVVFTVKGGATISAIAASTGSTLYTTLGYGC